MRFKGADQVFNTALALHTWTRDMARTFANVSLIIESCEILVRF